MRTLLLLGVFVLAGCGSGGDEVPVSKTPDPQTPEQRAAASRASELARGQAESYRQHPPTR
jgi:hypothetical protein